MWESALLGVGAPAYAGWFRPPIVSTDMLSSGRLVPRPAREVQ
jgi:hypothetical protein